MKRFALIIIISFSLIFCDSCSNAECLHDNEQNDNNMNNQSTREWENDILSDDYVVVGGSLYKEGDYKSVNGVLSIYNVDSKGFYFKIKLNDKSDSKKNQGSIGIDNEKTFAKYKKNSKAVMRGIDTDNTEDEDYNIIFSCKDDSIEVTETRNDGSKDVINPYSDLGIKFSGTYKKVNK